MNHAAASPVRDARLSTPRRHFAKRASSFPFDRGGLFTRSMRKERPGTRDATSRNSSDSILPARRTKNSHGRGFPTVSRTVESSSIRARRDRCIRERERERENDGSRIMPRLHSRVRSRDDNTDKAETIALLIRLAASEISRVSRRGLITFYRPSTAMVGRDGGPSYGRPLPND